MLGRIMGWTRLHGRRLVWALAVLAVFALGGWGFTDLQAAPGTSVESLSFLDVCYRTLRLFTLNLDLPDNASAPPQLWVAAFAAPVVTARGLAALFRNQLAGIVTQYLTWPRVVVFGANARTAALLAAEEPAGRRRDAVVVVDPDPVALATMAAPRVRTVIADGTSADGLARAAVRRAATVIVSTGDHVRNSSIATRVLALQPSPKLDLFVEVDGYGLARVLEQGGRRAGVETTPFSAPVMAIESVLDQLEDERRAKGLPPLLAADPDGEPATLALFGSGALLDAAALDLYRRRRLHLLADTAAAKTTPRIVVFGPDAEPRRDALVTLLGTGLQALDVEAVNAALGQLVELDIGTARHLARYRLRQVLVLIRTDLDCGIAVALARHLGPQAEVVLVNESPTTPIGDEIERQTAASPLMGRVRLFRMTDRAYRSSILRSERRVDRLAQALLAEPGGPTDGRRAAAQSMIAATEAGGVTVRRDALATLNPPHLPLLTVLGLDPPLAAARAGLTVDFQHPDTLLQAGRRLLAAESPAAFATWCEVARLRSNPADLRSDAPTEGPGDDLDDIRAVLSLREATLGDPHARGALPAPAPCAQAGHTIVLCAGSSDEACAELLRPAWLRPADDLTVWTTAPPDSRLIAAAAAEGVTLRPAPLDGSARRRGMAIWRALIAAGAQPGDVRVVALPGAAIDEILIARALGATVGRVEVAGGADLSRLVLGGGTHIIPLPDDRMTVRAFLRRSTWPADMGDPMPVAAGMHRLYVERHRSRKQTDDPALEPWDRLSPWLRASNLALVHDVPNKLAVIGLRLAPAAADSAVDLSRAVDEHIALLAEQEHGRFTAERLTSGWTSGVRDPARFMTPHLKRWTALDREAKRYDREVVRDLMTALGEQGLAAVPWAP